MTYQFMLTVLLVFAAIFAFLSACFD